jgi:8-oxo-dGTP diphosphatase
MTFDASDVSSHPTAPAGLRLAVSVVVYQESRFLLVERAKNPGKGMYAFPGGKVEAGESLSDAARRELLEETGLVAGEVAPLTQVTIHGVAGGFLLHVFLAESVIGNLVAGDDAASAGWYLLEELNALAVPQSVREVATMVAGFGS